MSAEPLPATPPGGNAASDAAAARVLVIDDSITILKVVGLILAGHGYDVAIARDGAEGFEQLRTRGPFDLVLLDFVMPRMNGYQFCRQLRADEQHRRLPVVLMSARTNTIGDRFVEQTGAVDALSKPFDARALVAVVGNVLSKRQAEGQRSMPNPDTMVDEDELSVEASVGEGPASQHFRSLGKMSGVIVDALAPTISRMRPQDLQVPELVANTIARCLTPQLMVELVQAGDDLDLEDGAKEILRGDLGLMPLAEVLQMLQLRRQTGVMVAYDRTKKAKARFYIRGGMLHFGEAEGLDDEFRLGRYFIEPGWLTREELEGALADQPEGVLMGEWLFNKEMITEAQLDHALCKQSAELVYEVLRWVDGRFVLTNGEFTETAEKARLDLGLSELVLEGFRRVDEWRLMADTINFDAVLLVDQVALATLDENKIGQFEQSVLMAINGTRTAREVMEVSDLASFDAIKSIYGFLQSRIVRELNPRREGASKTSMDVDEQTAALDAEPEAALVSDDDEDEGGARTFISTQAEMPTRMPAEMASDIPTARPSESLDEEPPSMPGPSMPGEADRLSHSDASNADALSSSGSDGGRVTGPPKEPSTVS